jgi:hypothetical protein
MQYLKLAVGLPLYVLAFTLRLVLIPAGWAGVGFSLAGAGLRRSPRMWHWCRPANKTLPSVAYDVQWWWYLFPILLGLVTIYSYGRWHELISIGLIFCCIGCSIGLAGKERWVEYWWYAIRNPLEGLDSMLEQPSLERQPNPDRVVRSGADKSHSRWTQDGVFWEYWYLRRLSDDRFFEFRIGWKYVDGNEDFVPTLQFGPKR